MMFINIEKKLVLLQIGEKSQSSFCDKCYTNQIWQHWQFILKLSQLK